jgi:hypothetical protein
MSMPIHRTDSDGKKASSPKPIGRTVALCVGGMQKMYATVTLRGALSWVLVTEPQCCRIADFLF